MWVKSLPSVVQQAGSCSIFYLQDVGLLTTVDCASILDKKILFGVGSLFISFNLQ